jgi:hypothetical protein
MIPYGNEWYPAANHLMGRFGKAGGKERLIARAMEQLRKACEHTSLLDGPGRYHAIVQYATASSHAREEWVIPCWYLLRSVLPLTDA